MVVKLVENTIGTAADIKDKEAGCKDNWLIYIGLISCVLKRCEVGDIQR